MNLDEFIWKKRTTAKKLGKIVGMTPQSLGNVKLRKNSPHLLTAVKLVLLSEEEINFEELLSKKDQEDLEKWLLKKDKYPL